MNCFATTRFAAARLGTRCALASSNRRVELARGRRGVGAGGKEEGGVRGGVGKRDGRAAGAGLGDLGAKRQQGRVREELLEDGRVALDEQLAVRQVRAHDVHPKTDVREHEEGLAVEVREPHVAPARQPMLRGHVGVEVLRHELVAGWAQRDAQVRVGALRIRRELRVEDEPRHKLRRELRKPPARRRCCRCHRHRPLLPTQRRQVSAQRLRARREIRGCGQRELASLVEFDVVLRPAEQLGSEFAFQPLDGPGEGGLGEVEGIGSRGNRAFFRDGLKLAQLFKLHVCLQCIVVC
ncbi:Uncharacterised protein [Corynebacterium diphtheriae]|nr:Uncharacterised protein [Corynebacterium diphtheriae]